MDDLHENVDHTPYEGLEVHGRVRDVFLRGHRAVRAGRLAPDLPVGALPALRHPGHRGDLRR